MKRNTEARNIVAMLGWQWRRADADRQRRIDAFLASKNVAVFDSLYAALSKAGAIEAFAWQQYVAAKRMLTHQEAQP